MTTACEPTFNISKRKDVENKNYAVKIFSTRNVFAVWDLKRHLKFGGKTSLAICDSWNDLGELRHPFTDIYKELWKKGSGIFEKIMIVDMDAFNAFFEHFDIYMAMNDYDTNFSRGSKAVLEESEKVYNQTLRKRYSTTQAARDAKFREQVLAAYNGKCAICRCCESLLLETAHIKPVAEGGSDETKNGICLCRNHHRMFDKKLIQIDFEKRTLSNVQESVRKMAWYREFICADGYAGKILSPEKWGE